jgi:signal transduction histidine kinase
MARQDKITESRRLAEKLRGNTEKILIRWENLARNEIPGADQQTQLSFRDDIPRFLNELADAIENDAPFASIGERLNVFQKHGKARAQNPHYNIDNLLKEYFLLRNILLDLLEEETLMKSENRAVVLNAIDEGILALVREFNLAVDAHREAVMSSLVHDLRSPLTAIKISLDLLKRRIQQSISKTDSLFERLEKNINRIDKMIGTILDVALVRSGKGLKLVYIEQDLRTVIHPIVDDFKKIYGQDRIHWKEGSEIVGKWNTEYIQRAIENLISNALKYGDSSKPVTLQLISDSQTVSILVHNWGKPITIPNHDQLFQPFERGPRGNEEGQSGWGIGLTLVRGVSEAHGGKADFESSEEKGTTFKMTLSRNSRDKSLKVA